MRPRRAAALAMMTVLALAVLGAWRSVEIPDDGAALPDQVVAISSSNSTKATSTSTTVATTHADTTLPVDPDPVSVIRRALSAWGRFAVSGDLAEVEPWFAPDGPQYGQFVTEAGSAEPVGGPAYRVTFRELVTDPADPDRIRGRVVFVRTGEPSQSFDWWIVLRRHEGRLQVWTVEEAEG